MAPSLPFAGQLPNTARRQAVGRKRVRYASDLEEELISESGGSEYEEQDESPTRGFAAAGVRPLQEDVEDMQDEEEEESEDEISAVADTRSTRTRGRPTRVLCVCPNTGTVALVRAGACSDCGRLLHTSCCVRKPVGRSGFTCYYCKNGEVEDIRYRKGLLTHVDEGETRHDEGPESADEDDDILETTLPAAAPTESARPKKDVIECVCPARAMKERKRLAQCVNCGVIFHKACRVRNPPDRPGFRCFNCPADVGLLVDVPDRFNNKPVSAAKTVVPPRRVPPQPKPSLKITESSPNPKTHKSKLRRELNNLGSDEAVLDIENVQQEAPDDPSPRRRSLRAKRVAEEEDEEALEEPPQKRRSLRPKPVPEEKEEAITKRKPRKSAHGFTVEEIESQYTAILHVLMRKAKEGRQDTRSNDLHEVFLRNLPLDALWASYCVIPDGRAANAEVRDATEVHFANYQVEPKIAVPEAWGKELKYRLRLLLDATVNDGQAVRLSTRLWDKDISIALRHLQDIARDALHRGSYKGKRGRLGVLGEVLGLSEKGTFWKGGDRFAVSGVPRSEGR